MYLVLAGVDLLLSLSPLSVLLLVPCVDVLANEFSFPDSFVHSFAVVVVSSSGSSSFILPKSFNPFRITGASVLVADGDGMCSFISFKYALSDIASSDDWKKWAKMRW